jgi:hypothetical protein
VTRDKKGQVREIRGLRRCKSNVCAQAPFVNRDLNAALNILRCGIEAERPTCLARETRHPKGDRWMMGKPESRKHESASIPERAVVAEWCLKGIFQVLQARIFQADQSHLPIIIVQFHSLWILKPFCRFTNQMIHGIISVFHRVIIQDHMQLFPDELLLQ